MLCVELFIRAVLLATVAVLQQTNGTGRLATLRRRLLTSEDNNFEVVIQQSTGIADCTPAVLVQLDTPAQEHAVQELKSQVTTSVCSSSLRLYRSQAS